MPPRKPPVSSSVSYTSALSHASADKRIDILRAVGASGSISQAARDAGVSYKAAWQAIDTLTNLAGAALVERVVGGAGGGGARLTAAGAQLLDVAARMAQARNQVLGQLDRPRRTAAGAPQPAPAFGPLAIRTSMRNQLPCEVMSLQTQGTIVRVHLGLTGAAALVARITRESAQLLALSAGQGVIVLCKATAVSVTPAAGAAGPGANVLAGRAARVSRGAQGDEVSAVLDGGLALVGFAPARSKLRAGSRVLLAVDESALVLALAG